MKTALNKVFKTSSFLLTTANEIKIHMKRMEYKIKCELHLICFLLFISMLQLSLIEENFPLRSFALGRSGLHSNPKRKKIFSIEFLLTDC
jgi:hypothetical protein